MMTKSLSSSSPSGSDSSMKWMLGKSNGPSIDTGGKLKIESKHKIKPGVSICLDVVSIESLNLDTWKK